MDVSKIDLNKLPVDKRKEFIQYAIKLDEKKKEEKVNQDFLTFVKSVWPDFVEGKHHKKIAEQFNDYETMQQGLDWFRQYFPKEYMVLLD